MDPNCDTCQSTFQSYAPLELSIVPSGSDILVYAKNNSRSIIHIQRLILCVEYPGFTVASFLREPQFLGGAVIEQGTTSLKYRVTAATALSAVVEGEYWEVGGRNVSCKANFEVVTND